MLKFFKIGTGRYKIVIEDCSKALEINPKHSWILYQRGLAHLHLGNFREALADLEMAARSHPDYRILAGPLIAQCRRRIAV